VRKNQIAKFINTSYRKSGGVSPFGLGEDEEDGID
jgi:hypothetical protein